MNPDLVARTLAIAAYARAAGACPEHAVAVASGLVHGTVSVEALDTGEPYAVGVLREAERQGVRCRAGGHL